MSERNEEMTLEELDALPPEEKRKIFIKELRWQCHNYIGLPWEAYRAGADALEKIGPLAEENARLKDVVSHAIASILDSMGQSGTALTGEK